MFHEIRIAIRAVARRRALALAIVLTLTIAIGANSVIFAAIDAVLLKPLPYPAADRLVAVYEVNVSHRQMTSLVAPVRLEEWNRANRSFDGLAGSYFENMTDTTGTLPERVAAMRTSPRFFSVLGASAALGRLTTADEEVFGGRPVVVLSDAFRRARLNADASAIGHSLVLGGVRRTVVGVMPSSFEYPTATTDVWIPAQMPAGLLSVREARFYTAVGRLKTGVTAERAQEDLTKIQARLGEQFPKTDAGWSAGVVSLKDEQIGGVRGSLWLLFGAVALVLLAACGNIACLLLAEATRREREMAIRIALGAARGTVLRQLLLEGLALSVMGSIAGLLLARWGIDALRKAAAQLPRAAELHMDGRVIAFTLMLGVVATLLFALAPALQITRRHSGSPLARGARGQIGGRQHLQRALVATQIALAVVLLVGSGLLIRSFIRLQHVSPGFDPDDVVTFRISASWSERPEDVANRHRRTLERLMSIPGVISAALGTTLPATVDSPPDEFRIIGRDTGERYFAVARQVSAAYFRTLRIPMLHGETCRDDARTDSSSNVVVSRAFADRFFPGDTPIGHRLVQRSPAEIVGVVGDVRERGLMHAPEPVAYFCGSMPFWPDPHYILRTDPAQAAVTMASIRESIHEIEPRRAVYAAARLTDTLSSSVSQPRLNTLLLTLFATTTLMLAGIGLYGMVSQFVGQRRREIGLRVALGARPGHVLSQVLRQGALVIGAGVACGLGAALLLGRFMGALVFGVSTHDAVTFALVPLALAAIAGIATMLPARRAIRVDPIEALRET